MRGLQRPKPEHQSAGLVCGLGSQIFRHLSQGQMQAHLPCQWDWILLRPCSKGMHLIFSRSTQETSLIVSVSINSFLTH